MKSIAMVHTLRLLVAAALLVTAHAQTQPRETLLAAVRRTNGPIVRGQAPGAMPKTSFESLVRESDLIVRGTLSEPYTYLAEEGTTLYTDYAIRNVEVLFSSITTTSPKPTFSAEGITLTQLGGTTALEGHQVIVSHRALEPLRPGMEGIFLLSRREGKNFLVREYYGAYELRDGMINALARHATLANEIRGKTVAEFRAQISGALQ
jgi:hypothetical protein